MKHYTKTSLRPLSALQCIVSPLTLVCLLLMLCLSSISHAETASDSQALSDIKVIQLPGDRVQLRIEMTPNASIPKSFTMDSPSRLVFDFNQVTNAMAQKNQSIGVGSVHSFSSIQAQGRTRLVINLVKMVPYDVALEQNEVVVTIGQPHQASTSSTQGNELQMAIASGEPTTTKNKISHIDFRRGEEGEGRVIIQLSDPSIPVDIQQEGQSVVASFVGTRVPKEYIQRLDVMDFSTPVRHIDITQKGQDAKIIMSAKGNYDYVAYQINHNFVIDFKPLTQEEVAIRATKPKAFVGERLSLNFQDIEVRSVLQLIADFTGLNIVTTDTVDGNITLRLQNVPWDQAMDMILKTKGLSKRMENDVILIAPSEELAAREQVELEASMQVEKLAPLRAELIQVNYARADEMAEFLKSEENSLLTERGSVSVDTRTNTLLVSETPQKLDEVRKLIAALDRPVRQVLIEARIVVANSDFRHELGVRLGLSNSSGDFNTSGTLEATDLLSGGTDPEALTLADRLNIDLPVDPAAGSVGFTISRLPGGTLLDLELSALESEGNGEIISSPRLITSNQREALIESGEEVPFRTTTSSNGVTEVTITFKKVVLSLQVTPQITPDDRIILQLEVIQDTRGEETEFGPAIDTQKIETEVLADNGETIVLGGVYRRTKTNTETGVPYLRRIPYLGALFRKSIDVDEKQELLIFVTPKIIKEELSV